MNVNRRSFVQLMGASLLTPYTLVAHSDSGPYADYTQLDLGINNFGSNSESIFDLSVASGDPAPRGVILWTHIRDTEYDGTSPLFFQVSLNKNFTQLVMEGSIDAADFSAQRDHTVNLDLDGHLQPRQTYYYRFIYKGVASRTGRCKTLPEHNQDISQLRFAVLTCQDYTTGYFNAYNHLANEDLDFVIHLGDFIYEYATYPSFDDQIKRPIHLPSGEKVAIDIRDFRHIYRTFRSDKNLQRAMEQHTFIITWDDHETANDTFWDYDKDTLGAPDHPYTTDSRFNNDPQKLWQLRIDAQKAWTEYVPARVMIDENASHPFDYLKLYRSFRVGKLMELFMTDTRTYRSEQPCGDGNNWDNYWCYDYNSPGQTMLGNEQKQWLIDGITQSSAKWKMWGNQTLLAQLALTVLGHQVAYANYDAWDGYQKEREDIMKTVKNRDVNNFVVLTGDLHTHIASYLKINYRNINNWDYSNLVGLELMTPSITSPNIQDIIDANIPLKTDLSPLLNGGAQLNNPHIKDFNSAIHGYAVCEVEDNKLYWDVYNIDHKEDKPNTHKETYKRFKYDPWWMWLRKR
ncbi:alkaline phosphatase [Pleionea sp. CnH1-48]|uniref:alkaline phosphatase D family protein n=1 Tax=Pleionea sp. CnH1-48 TaxID=2954494 RepID=UPI002097998D|nr:alkaline phosphatase D family protein [Pleionea sp. CnH1-48]MCO7223342.1 alkaline phosphatase D family protein [Pleionea sp. CnH1-48]